MDSCETPKGGDFNLRSTPSRPRSAVGVVVGGADGTVVGAAVVAGMPCAGSFSACGLTLACEVGDGGGCWDWLLFGLLGPLPLITSPEQIGPGSNLNWKFGICACEAHFPKKFGFGCTVSPPKRSANDGGVKCDVPEKEPLFTSGGPPAVESDGPNIDGACMPAGLKELLGGAHEPSACGRGEY